MNTEGKSYSMWKKIENTYSNCKKLAQLSVDSMDVESLIEFYQITLLDRLLDSQEAFEAELENMDIKTQEELDGLDGDE